MIAFCCPHCGSQLQVKEGRAGKSGPCPNCSRVVQAPAADTSFPSDPADTAGRGSGVRASRQSTLRLSTAAGDTAPSGPGLAPPPDYPFLAPPQGPDELGRLGPYLVREVLGVGAMGVVFRAEDPHLRRPVALKVMKPSLAAYEEFHRRFLREAQLAAAIDHEHVVTIYQVGEDRGIPFLAMKLLQGETLEDRLAGAGGRLPLAEVLRVGREAAEGLAAAHERGLIHRDIKPANVWLEEGRDRVKIVDFGLARAAGDDGRFTQAGAVIGTPHFMAPEQANAGEVDARCDLFSLGGVLYLASTGELPFGGKDTLSVLSALATKIPPSPRAFDPTLPRAFSELVMGLLAKDRDDRPQSAREVVEAIEAIEAIERGEVEVVEASPEEPPPAPGREKEEAAALAAPAVREATGAGRKGKRAKKARPPGARRKKRSGAERDWGRRVLVAALVLLGVAVLVLLVGVIRHAARGRAPASKKQASTRAVLVARVEHDPGKAPAPGLGWSRRGTFPQGTHGLQGVFSQHGRAPARLYAGMFHRGCGSKGYGNRTGPRVAPCL
jgi:hypothetical protein